MESQREYYINYFRHMEEEHKRIPLGGMAWDDISLHLYEAIDKYKLFTEQELEEKFPTLLK